MKKFLSLVLALIMTMSLVTIGASAAEYKDFTDKDEIQYEEAVAVLNRLGIITGYSEGDFRPEGELTRGAAAKIIASLLIGPEAANNLSPTTAPFKDVPLDHTFAGPIAYCSTLKIINGYGDGSFQPGGTLTGYAFSKMLLGALGYDGNEEGFTGAGWSMNVMRLGGEAGLFDRISFKGNEAVNREQAAQLALNTLKGTLVEYTGGMNIVAGDASVTTRATRSYKTSNQEYAAHINNKKAGGQLGTAANALYTVEFGEEHFVDLRMTHDRNTYDDFGRPSNEWSYKKVTIGTFPIEADKVYTEQVAHNVTTVTNASKARALELTGFEVLADRDHGATNVTINGKPEATGVLKDVGDIANYTDNGTIVEIYVDEDNADWIKDVVVIKTQLMEVKRLGKDSVSLDLYDNGSANKGKAVMGFNQKPIDEKVDNVEVDDAYYSLLSGLKVGDRVAVVPVTIDGGSSYTVAKAYVPETASGKLNKVSTYGTGKTVGTDVNTIGVTVGDTAYDVALWNKDLTDIDGNKLDVTTKDVTLTLDEFGNALLAEDVGATSDFMVVGSYYQSLVNGKLVNFVKGWDISGEELELNLGSKTTVAQASSNIQPGDLAYYTNATSGDADWVLSDQPAKGVFDVYTDIDTEIAGGTTTYSIKASNTRIRTLQDVVSTSHPDYVSGSAENFKPWIDKNIKFIYVTFDSDSGDVDSVEIKNGVQAASNEELKATYKLNNVTPRAYNAAQLAVDVKNGVVKPDGTVKAVVIKNESNDAVATNMLYIVNYEGSVQKRSDDGELVYEYTVAMNGANGIIDDEMTIYSTKKLNRGDWARYTEVKDDNFENFYALTGVNQQKRATSTMEANFKDVPTSNKALVRVDETTLRKPNGDALTGADVNISSAINNLGAGDNNAAFLLNLRYARWVDLTGNGIDNFDDLYDITHGTTKEYDLKNVRASMIFNDDSSKDNFRQVAMIVIQSVGAANSGSSGDSTSGTRVDTQVRLNSRGNPIVDFTVTRPSWAASDAEGTLSATLYVNGVNEGPMTITDKASGASSVVSAQDQTVVADDASDVDVRNIGVVWDKVVVQPEANTSIPEGVKVTSPIAKDASTINVKVSPVSSRAAGDITITVKEGTKVLLDAHVLTPEELTAAATPDGANITLTGGTVSGTAAITVNVTKEAEAAAQTLTVTGPTDWTATGSPYTVNAETKKATVTLTYKENGALDPVKTLTITPPAQAAWTAGAASFTNGDASNPAKFTFEVTVTGNENVTIPATVFTVADAPNVGDTTYGLTVNAGAGWVVKTVNGAALTSSTKFAENTAMTVILEQENDPAADTAAVGDLATAKQGISGLTEGVTLTTVKITTQGKKAVEAVYSYTAADPQPTINGSTIDASEVDTLNATEYYVQNAQDSSKYDAWTAVAGESLPSTLYTRSTTTPASDAVKAQVTITFTMPAKAVSFTCNPDVTA